MLQCTAHKCSIILIFKHKSLRMRRTYASKCELCPSNAKYRVIKFNFKYVPTPHPQTQDALWPTDFRKKIYTTYPRGILGVGGNRVVEAKEISFQLKT